MRIHSHSVGTTLLRLAGRIFLSALLMAALAATALAHAGSVYVPVDHWAYPAAERLAALTSTQEEVRGMRPWTRMQFARFLERAREMPHDSEAEKLQNTLEKEFSAELNSAPDKAALESAYTRSMQIAGEPLRDSYHFGQTIADDFGRPYGQGFNTIEGTSGYVQERAGMLYLRAEYQHGASLDAPPQSAIDSMNGVDEMDPGQSLHQGGPAVDYPRLLDSYVGASFTRWTATLGKQSLWWGPDTGGAFLYTNNIEPIWMGRLTNDKPYKIPVLGNIRFDFYYGKLQGHGTNNAPLSQPWTHGEKITLQPFKSLAIGFSRTDVFLGVGRGFTFGRLWKSYVSVGDNQNADAAQNDPGDRRGGLDVTYKLPKIPATFYLDSYCDDDPNPLAQPKRSAWRPGLYFARLPGPLAKLDLRMEGGYTASEDSTISNGFNYWNGIYKYGYTNKGLLIGDTMGRAGVTWQAWSTYWFSPRNKLQVSYRNQYVSPQFVAGGMTQNDIRGTSNFVVKHNFEVVLGVQSERVVLPLVTGSVSPKYNVSGWAGVTYWPDHRLRIEQ